MGVQKKAAKLNTGSPHFAALIQTAAFMAVWICLNPTLSKAGDLNVAEFLMSGDFARVRVTGASEYDLIGELIE